MFLSLTLPGVMPAVKHLCENHLWSLKSVIFLTRWSHYHSNITPSFPNSSEYLDEDSSFCLNPYIRRKKSMKSLKNRTFYSTDKLSLWQITWLLQVCGKMFYLPKLTFHKWHNWLCKERHWYQNVLVRYVSSTMYDKPSYMTTCVYRTWGHKWGNLLLNCHLKVSRSQHDSLLVRCISQGSVQKQKVKNP